MRTTLLLALLGLMLPHLLVAQQWSSEEADLLRHVRHCWDGYGTRSWDEQVRECGLDTALVYWWTQEDEPRGISWMRQSVEENWPAIDVIGHELSPIRVSHRGSLYFLFYRGSRTFRRSQGPAETVRWIGMEIWERTASGWKYLGGTGTPSEDRSD